MSKRTKALIVRVRHVIAVGANFAGEFLAVKHGRVLRVLGNDLQNFIRASRKWR